VLLLFFIIFLFWIKMHVRVHEIWFFILFEECIYECLKPCKFSEWKCMLEWINSFYLFDFVLFFSWRMHLWIRKILWIFRMKMHAWMHEFFLSFWYCSFFKNAFMSAWNFMNFLNESACLNTLIIFVFFDFVLFLKKKRMHLWMHKTWFFLFYYFWRMQIWMHEILFFFYFEWKWMFECMKFYFWFS